MSDDSPVERWRTWPRHGDYILAPDDSTFEERLAAVEALTYEKYGIDPQNPPPLRRDIVRKGNMREDW
jgi:hypothetical protein